MKEVAVYGPYLGELGHEVRAWAPWVRYQIWNRPTMDHVVVSKPGHSLLYPDTVRFIPFDTIVPSVGDFMGTKEPLSCKEQQRIQCLHEGLQDAYDVRLDQRPLLGGKHAIEMARRTDKQEFLMELPEQRNGTDARTPRVGLFMRNRDHGNERNLGEEFWRESLLSFMGQYPMATFYALGHKNGNLIVDWAKDRRHRGEYALWKTVHEMSHVDFVWGESSGTMHLALAACGKDICVSYAHREIRDRYVVEDNWHKRRVRAVPQKKLTPEGWAREAVELAEEQIKDRLEA